MRRARGRRRTLVAHPTQFGSCAFRDPAVRFETRRPANLDESIDVRLVRVRGGGALVPSARSPVPAVMRFHTYSKFSPELADAVDLQSLLEKLADFLLQSGFAGGRMSHPYWGDFGGDADRSLEALKEAILNALIESGQFTPEMLQALRGDGDEEAQAKLAQLLDDLYSASPLKGT